MNEKVIASHYQSGNLEQRLSAALVQDGFDPLRPTIAELTPYDQFHGRGIEATDELASKLDIQSDHHLLDVGSGIGGPARYLADRFGCKVTGIDLTEEFCEVAQELTKRVGLQAKVEFHVGDALHMPFPYASFDGAYSMNVSMNIADKAALYREINRVLRPGGWLALSELAKGPGEDMGYPTPWAATAASSFLATPAETRQNLEQCGFAIENFEDASEKVISYGKKARQMVEQGKKPPHRAVQLIHGERAAEAMKNTSRGVAEQRIIPIEVICRKT